jgi:ubiquinone/menaquinone biosynthesis C-methylase UbiE
MGTKLDDKGADFINKNMDILCCPGCEGQLELIGNGLKCLDCYQVYPFRDNIPQLFWPNEWDASEQDVTEEIKSFYEKNPFPNYDDFDNVASLVEKAKKGLFAKLLDEQIPFGVRILDCGCGTGQLTNFLSIANRTVIGTDMCLNSLRMGQEFKEKNALKRACFYQMNLFRPCFKPGSFDLVISNGVLHHTSNPFLAFKTISRLVRPNGYIMVGLYHKYGRLITDTRRRIFYITKDKFKFLDRRIVNKDISQAKRDAWFMDQYKNPHESKHTVGEVLKWLNETGYTFVNSIPKTNILKGFGETERLFKPDKVGSLFERFLVNIGMSFKGGSEGGFFVVIAKRSE